MSRFELRKYYGESKIRGKSDSKHLERKGEVHKTEASYGKTRHAQPGSRLPSSRNIYINTHTHTNIETR